MAFPLDPTTLDAANYIPFLKHGGKINGDSHLKADSVGPSRITPIPNDEEYVFDAVVGTEFTLERTNNARSGAMGSVVMEFDTQNGADIKAGDWVEVNAAGDAIEHQGGTTNVIGVAVEDQLDDGTVMVKVLGLAWGKNDGNSGSILVGQYALGGGTAGTVQSHANPQATFGRVLTSSASGSNSSLILIRN